MTHARKTPRALMRPTTSDQAADDSPFWIGDNLVEPSLNQITSGGRTQHIEHQVMRILIFLAAHPDQPLSRDAILKSIWAETAPNDEGLTQAICKLRKALGDRPGEGNVIQTIRKVGYRLVAPVSRARVAPLNKPLSFSTERLDNPPGRHIRIRVNGGWLAAATLLSMTLFVVSQTV